MRLWEARREVSCGQESVCAGSSAAVLPTAGIQDRSSLGGVSGVIHAAAGAADGDLDKE